MDGLAGEVERPGRTCLAPRTQGELGPSQDWVFGILGVPPTLPPLPSPRSTGYLPAVHLREQGCDFWARS